MSLSITGTYQTFGRNANLPSEASFTIAVWVKPTGITSAGNQNAILFLSDVIDASAANRFNLSQIQTTTELYIYRVISGVSAPSAYTNDLDTTAGNWYYVAITSSGTGTNAVTGYVFDSSGTLIESKTRDGGTFSVAPGYAGIGAQNSNCVTGYYAYGRMWDVALSQGELEAEAVSASPIKTASFNSGFATNNGTDVGPNARDWSGDGSFDTTGANEPTIFRSSKGRMMLMGIG